MATSVSHKSSDPVDLEEVGKSAQFATTTAGACYGCCATTVLVSAIALIVLIYCAASGNYFLPATNYKLLGAGAGVIGLGTLAGTILGYACGGVIRSMTELGQEGSMKEPVQEG